jgi:Gpi18-like mannosyltransferase
MKHIKTFLAVAAIAIIPTLAVWAPFYLRTATLWNIPLPVNGMQTVVSNYDGPLYIVVAKTLYNKEAILKNFSFDLPYEYYAAHFPLYPATIRVLSYLTGYVWATLLATLLAAVFAHVYFYRLALDMTKKEHYAIWLTMIFAVLPARWLIVRSVGSPEPLFVGAIIACLFHARKKQYLLAGLFGAIATLTKSPGILLFPALFLSIVLPRFRDIVTTHHMGKFFRSLHISSIFIFLIPLALVAVFGIYQITFGDFFAYFNSGDNIHLFFPPFQIFNFSQPWVGTHWLEEIIFIYLLIAVGISRLIAQKEWLMAWLTGIFFTVILFVSHRDVLRYALPAIPFVILSFRDQLVKREFVFIMILLIIPIYLFSIVFIVNNIMPIGDWTPLL